ncbi:unnamed protein product [Arabidopsis halleri]
MVVTVAWCSCCGGVRLLDGGAVRGWFLRWLLARSSSPLCCSRLLCDSSLTVRCGSSRVCGGLDLLRCGFGLFRLIPVRFSSACGPPVLFASVGVEAAVSSSCPSQSRDDVSCGFRLRIGEQRRLLWSSLTLPCRRVRLGLSSDPVFALVFGEAVGGLS